MKKLITLKNNYRLAQGFSLFRYMGDALVYAFLALFFHSLDLSPFETGTLLASVPIMAIVGNVVMSFLSKSIKYNLSLMKIIMPLEIAGMVAIGFFNSFVPVLLCSMVMNLCNSCFYSLFDGLAGDISVFSHKNYAGIRIFGSLAYFIASFTGGFLITAINYQYTFIIASCLYALAYSFLYAFEKDELSGSVNKEKNTGFLSYFIHNKAFVLYFLFYIFLLSMSNVSDNFFSLYAKEVNKMPENIYGIVYASMILTEILIIFLSIKLRKANNKILLIVASLFLLTRTFLLCFDLPYFMLFVIPIFRGLGWGLVLGVHLNTVKTLVDREYVTKSILVMTIGMQIINTIYNQFGPTIVDRTSYNAFFLILLVNGFIGLIFLIIAPLNRKMNPGRRKKSANQ